MMWILLLPALAIAEPSHTPARPYPTDHFISTLQIAVHESNPFLTDRSRQLVFRQVSDTMDSLPQLKAQKYELQTKGDEILFHFVSDSDIREPVQLAVAQIIGHLNGRVRARGRSRFYRTHFSESPDVYLWVRLSDDRAHITSISAQAVPLRELLRELRLQLGELSYLIPGDCADRPVEWSFGEAGAAEPKTVDHVMTELATLFGLTTEKKNGTYIFSGHCNEENKGPLVRPPIPAPPLPDYFHSALYNAGGTSGFGTTQVFLPWDE